jgi:hypothetical protein
MTQYSFPVPSAREFVERVDDFPPGVHARRWVLRDDNQQHYHGVIPLSEDPAFVELHWKPDSRSREQLVGRFRLHLGALVTAGYARREGEGAAAKEVRLRFYRGDRGVVFIQARKDAPALPVGTIDASLG